LAAERKPGFKAICAGVALTSTNGPTVLGPKGPHTTKPVIALMVRPPGAPVPAQQIMFGDELKGLVVSSFSDVNRASPYTLMRSEMA